MSFRMRIISLVGITILCVSRGTGEELITGIDASQLVEAMSLQLDDSEQSAARLSLRWPVNNGPVLAMYHPRGQTANGTQLVVYIAVKPTIASARELAALVRQSVLFSCSLRPANSEQVVETLGDEGWFFPHADEKKYGKAVFRRKNAVIYTAWEEATRGAGLFATRQIDELIRDNRQVAPQKTFDSTPEIISTGIPDTLAVRPMKEPLPPPAPGTRRAGNWPEFRNPGGGDLRLAFVNIQPEFRGLGDVSKLRLKLVRTDGVRSGNLLQGEVSPAGHEFAPGTVPIYVPDGPDRVRVVKRGEAATQGIDGRFIMRIAVPDEAQTLKLTMIAATEDNLIVTKDVEVRVVPEE